MKSMTGFARIVHEDDNFKIKIEIKSVNNKYFNLNLKSHYILNPMEQKIRTLASTYVSRGSVDLRIDFYDKREKSGLLVYDEQYAESLMKVLENMEQKFDEKIPSKIEIVIKNPNVISRNDDEEDSSYQEVLVRLLSEAFLELNKSRSGEGEHLKAYFAERMSFFENLVIEVKKYRDTVVKEHRERLIGRLNTVSADIKFKEEDILKEILIFADRSDISEELSRLDSHIIQFKKELNYDKNGKKMDFIIQEMFREVNTTGVKANCYDISKLIVEAKSELEKIREQVQNVE